MLLLFGLAALPLVLDPTTPLRYRVQAFMQYATGGAFWLIAILTLVVQRRHRVPLSSGIKRIWQTMTKPVAAWQYILGKWLGVVGALLRFCWRSPARACTCSPSTFARQPAVGETCGLKPYSIDRRVTEDRMNPGNAGSDGTEDGAAGTRPDV